MFSWDMQQTTLPERIKVKGGGHLASKRDSAGFTSPMTNAMIVTAGFLDSFIATRL
ncbi:hypothetical protein [Paenibacillus sp. 1P07SE]|uniref:hypothetical protein n=1 Tax=Paenibacillus sp. 1P07SE TaxID=3132209 RepID=UPI0039A4A698